MVGTSPTTFPEAFAAATALRTSSIRSITGITFSLVLALALAATVRTVWVIQAGVGDQEVGEDLATDQRLRDDPRHVLDLHPAVPDAQGIDDDRRPVLALLEASRLVRPDQRAQPGLLHLGLECVAEGLFPVGVAAAPLVARGADIAADE